MSTMDEKYFCLGIYLSKFFLLRLFFALFVVVKNYLSAYSQSLRLAI